MVSVVSSPVPSPAAGGSAAAALPEATRRLAEQLQALSQVAETLTFRLLELEERLAAQEERFQPLLEAGPAAGTEAVEAIDLRLGDTEERLARMEAALAGLPLRPGTLRAQGETEVFEEEEILDQDPFPQDDGEQPFLDEEEEAFLERRVA